LKKDEIERALDDEKNKVPDRMIADKANK